MSEDNKKALRCSFCGRYEEQVERMIQGPGVRICDNCIRLCMDILEEDYLFKDAYNAQEIDLKINYKDFLPAHYFTVD